MTDFLILEKITESKRLATNVIKWLGKSTGIVLCTKLKYVHNFTKHNIIWRHKHKINTVLKWHGYDEKFLQIVNSVADKLGEILWFDMKSRNYCVAKILDRHYVTVNPACQAAVHFQGTAAQFQGLNKLTVKNSRRRVWETPHLGVTGWDLLSHFSEIWILSWLQLTSSSN